MMFLCIQSVMVYDMESDSANAIRWVPIQKMALGNSMLSIKRSKLYLPMTWCLFLMCSGKLTLWLICSPSKGWIWLFFGLLLSCNGCFVVPRYRGLSSFLCCCTSYPFNICFYQRWKKKSVTWIQPFSWNGLFLLENGSYNKENNSICNWNAKIMIMFLLISLGFDFLKNQGFFFFPTLGLEFAHQCPN